MTAKQEDNEDVLIIPLSSTKIKKIAQALSSTTAVRILQELANQPMSATELSKLLKMPLTTIKYNIDELMTAELIKVVSVKLSQKMREMKYYAPVKRALIFAPEKEETGVMRYLKKLLPYLLVLILSIPTGFMLRYAAGLLLSDPHEFPIDPVNLTFYAFIAGILFAIILLLFIRLLLKEIAKR